MKPPRVSIVIPAFNEVDTIMPTLNRLADAVSVEYEILVVVDSTNDQTISAVSQDALSQLNLKVLIQDLGVGPANAIRYGFMQSSAPVVVVTMADGSDDVRIIDDLVRLVERGCAIAAGSRYMPGGQQIGGPRVKKYLSQSAGLSLHFLAGVGTRDATNSFKAYSRDFVNRVGIDSRDGFEIGIELVSKARRLRLPIAEVPTIWLDRDFGHSNFQMKRWLPKYLHWYFFTYGKPLSFKDFNLNGASMEMRHDK